ncbi:MAG TPA: diguanylate cyclase [Eubacteriales bacterium]|nr:diguanylate cyclase [Eubacteriales bacterium]
MKRVRKNLQTDLSFILLIVLIFVYFVFLIYQEEYLVDNFLIAAVVFIIVLITYFTNLTVGLIINTTLILGYITYVIVQSVTKGIVVRSYVYFWIVMSPALTTAFSLFTMSTAQLQRMVADLDNKLVTISTLNEDTKLKNLRAFENDAGIYKSIAERYDIGFGIVVIQFKYQKELERLSKKEGMQQVVMEVIGAVRKATRAEDELYQLDGSEIMFAMLMLTKKEGLEVIHDRLKEAIAQINTSDILNTRQLVLDMRIGVAFDGGQGKSVMDLLQSAKDSMQYDV